MGRESPAPDRVASMDNAWYVRCGYALTSETEPFPYGDNRFGIPKRDDMYFFVLRKRLT
jgi:hypothetical protein